MAKKKANRKASNAQVIAKAFSSQINKNRPVEVQKSHMYN